MLELTATDIAARALREHYAVLRRDAGATVWETPQVASLRQWLTETWANDWPEQQLISSTQALTLWLDAVESDRLNILSPLACAREALRAERLAIGYQLDVEKLPTYNAEQQAWRRWRAKVRRRMQRAGWMLAEELPGIVTAGLEQGRYRLPERVLLHGLQAAASPSHAALLDALGHRAAIEHIDHLQPDGASITAWKTADRETQYQLAADLIAKRLSDQQQQLPRILVVTADTQARDSLQAAFIDGIAPWLRIAGDAHGQPWRWSNGTELASNPWVEAAQAIFDLTAEGNSFDAISRLLLTPQLWAGDLRADAALVDARLRDRGHPRLRMGTLLNLAPASLQPQLTALMEAMRNEPDRDTPSGWADHFRRRLDAMNWPGDAALPSAPFQAVRELRNRLARLAGFDAMLGTIDRRKALLWFGELLRSGHEPRVEHEQPILITTPADALGLPCDLMIVCDALIDNLPGRATPTPFIAIENQRLAGIPEARSDTHLAEQRERLTTLCQQARECVFLAPNVDQRGVEQLPTQLLELAWRDAAPPISAKSHIQQLSGAGCLSTPDADHVPPVSSADNVRGDASLFSAWFESPFFACCTHRLGIRPLAEVTGGLTASAQGNIIHDALETLWGRLQDSKTLAATDETTLRQMIDDALAEPLNNYLPEAAFGRVLALLEHARTGDLLMQWLNHERRRVDPFAVLDREKELVSELAGLPLRLRVDRVDAVHTAAGDRYLVLDYKTGREADPRGWRADRLRDPQLPLYATLVASAQLGIPQVDGIGFAHLKDGHPALSVASDWSGSLIEDDKAPKQNWRDQLAAWTEILTIAAGEFMAGRADIDESARTSNNPRYAWLWPLLDESGDASDPDGRDDA